MARLPLVYVEVRIYRVGRDDVPVFKERLELPPYILRAFAVRIPTLCYIAASAAGSDYGEDDDCRDWWRIVRSAATTNSDDGIRLEKLSRDTGHSIRRQLWTMDQDALLRFDLDSLVL